MVRGIVGLPWPAGRPGVHPGRPMTEGQMALLRCHNVVAERASGLGALRIRATALEPVLREQLRQGSY